MIERREGHFSGHGGTELFYQTWTPTKPTERRRATLVVTHGLAEHSECYSHTAEKLCALGWDVCAWDLRGHGRSEGKRGFVEEFRNFSLDLGHLLRSLKNSDRLESNFALIGHSMGGLVTLRYLVDADKTAPTPKAAVLSSPLLGVALEVPVVKDYAARVLNRFLPAITLNNEIKYTDLTRDQEFIKGYGSDPLRHDKISPGLYLGMFENIELVKARASSIQIPLLIQAAGQEKIVSLPAIREFFDKLLDRTNKKLIVYDESYHEIFNDLDREKVLKDLDAFLSEAMGVR